MNIVGSSRANLVERVEDALTHPLKLSTSYIRGVWRRGGLFHVTLPGSPGGAAAIRACAPNPVCQSTFDPH